MNTPKNNQQLQIRIDAKTKREAKKILDEIGMDMSAAVKIFFRQIINTRNFPCELRDANGFTLRGAAELRASIADAKASPKSFTKGSRLVKDALKD
jgi:addiction module RelB/DinJ family antitoxin